MRARSSKQAALYRKLYPERIEFLYEMGRCAVQGLNCDGCYGVAVHEMCRGKNRMRAFGVRAAWLPACGPCNTGDLDDATAWPLAKQLALKLLIDPRYFDLTAIRQILAVDGTPIERLPVVVSEADVLAALQTLLIERGTP